MFLKSVPEPHSRIRAAFEPLNGEGASQISSGDVMAISGQSLNPGSIKRPKEKAQWGMGPLASARDTFVSA